MAKCYRDGTNLKITESKLQQILENGITNILALSGDQPWKLAIDLVKAIRRLKGDATIGVAGYPEVHRKAISRIDDLNRLKEKVDAGANFIITNTCFSIDQLTEFIKSCRSIGITVPIIPGIFVPSKFAELTRICSICNVVVPPDQMEIFRRYQGDDEQFSAFAIQNATKLLTQIFAIDFERINGIHFITLNRYENIVEVVRRCDFK